jgi:hypothetical protein
MFDLDPRVDLDKVVPALLVDQELGGTGVSVLNGLGELDGIVQDGLTGLFSEMRSGGDFDDLHGVKEISMRKRRESILHRNSTRTHLLVSSLNGTITLK